MSIIPNPEANFTPPLKGYSGQGAFRFWCQTVLPLVYDDSLSYYELLNKVVNYLNNTISDVANMEDNVQGLHDAYVSLQNYVNEYFSTLDVQEEINGKLDEMASDGTLTALVSPLLPNLISDWLSEHITPTTPVVDNTLTIEGAAADAKTVGDRFGVVETDVDALESEVENARIDTNGVTRTTLGDAIRGQVSELKNALGTLPAFSPSNLHDGFISSSSGTWSGVGNPSYKCAIIPVNGSETLKIDTSELDGDAGIAALTEYVTPVTGATPFFSTENGWTSVKTLATNIITYDTLPSDAKFLYVYCGNPELSRLPKSLLIDGYDYSKSIVDNIQNTITNSVEFKNTFSEYKKIAVPLQNGYYWNSEQQKATLTEYSTYSASQPISATPETKYKAIVYTGTSTRQHAVLCVDSNYNILSSYKYSNGEQTYEFITPKNTAYILITKGSNDAEIVYYHTVELYELKYVDSETLDDYFYGPYNGKYLSVLGDSISAYSGEIPINYRAYYTGSNAGVSNATEMWYNVLCRILGMKPLRINAWSGSCVTSGVRDDTAYRPASAVSRCESLHSGSINPDVILIAMGVNDYSYTEKAEQFGDWDGTTRLGTADDLSDYITTDFKSAYATMLARIKKKYPNSEIFCITPWFVERRNIDTGITYLNRINKQEADYGKAIKDIAEIMGVNVIDGTRIGFNRYNFYPTYAEDSDTIPTHPNAAGHEVMGTVIAKALLNNRTL